MDGVVFSMNFSNVHGFEWDIGNSTKNFSKHGVAILESEEAFFNLPQIVAEDGKHSLHQKRFHLLGKTNAGRKLHLTFALKEKLGKLYIRVILSRDMSKKERQFYEK